MRRARPVVLMAAALVFTHLDGPAFTLDLHGTVQVLVGLVAGFGIGVVAAVMGVAGGELLIPTIVLLYGIDIKMAGSLYRCPRCWSRSSATPLRRVTQATLSRR